jgi:hypothetical protein
MAISAKQLQISAISFPIAEAARPCPSRFLGFGLSLPINMMNVEGAKVREPTLRAFTAQAFHKLDLALPIARVLVFGRAVLVPIILGAARRAKLIIARGAALTAFAVALPSGRKIARSAAILSGAVAQAIRVHFARLATVSAGDDRWGCPHRNCISNYAIYNKPKYFDAACRRIEEATKQPDMFVERPPEPKQESWNEMWSKPFPYPERI